jgi:predicted transcriptional regulator
MTSARESKLEILKKKRGPVPKELTDKIKRGNRIKSAIRGVLRNGPNTVPEIARATGIDTQDVFWHLMSLKKYGGVLEAGRNGDYFNYKLARDYE